MLPGPKQGYIDNYYSRTLTSSDVSYPPLAGVEEADVCVVGGGLAGINTALGLAQRGKSVIVVEAKRIGWGASGRNGGFVAKGYAAGHDELEAKLGLEHARKLVDLTKEGRLLIKKRIGEFNIDCGPVIHGVLTVSWKDNPEAIRQSIHQANDKFDLGLEYWPTEKVREHCLTERYFQGSFSPHDFQFHPLRYLHGLARAITGRGGRIYEESPVLSIKKDNAGWAVQTKGGTVKAHDVVVCCAVYSDGLDRRLENALFPILTYVTVTKPISDEALRASINTRYPIYDMRFVCDYYRVLEDNRILWGGRVALGAGVDDIAHAMMDDMLKVYPQLRGVAEPDLAWSGLLAYAPHKMPQIGRIAPGYWYNTGFGGHGLVPTTVGGEIIASAIAENDSRIELFKSFGIGYAGGKAGRYAAQMVYYWWRLRDMLDI
jgi:gamma-glutamylputrescine oxidase